MMTKNTKRTFIYLALAMLLSSCGGARVTKMGVGDVHDFRLERLSFGLVEATIVVDVYNGNKKNVTFDNARIELLLNDRMLAVATSRGSTIVAKGTMRMEIPVRIRFKMDGVGEIANLFLSKQKTENKQNLHLKGSFDISDSEKINRLQFNRKLSEKTLKSIGEKYGNLFDFNR